jgi:hypothetical protein
MTFRLVVSDSARHLRHAFAGEAKRGKSAAMLAAPLRWMHLPGYSAIILGRTRPAIRDSLLPKVFELYPRCGGQPQRKKDPALPL